MKARIRGSAMAALLVLTVSIVTFGGTTGAGANDGSPLVLGNPSNTSQSSTNLIMDRTDPNTFTTNAGAIQVVHAPDSNDIFPIGILATTGNSLLPYPDVTTGIYGDSEGDGIWGTGARNGIVGKTMNNAASGVYGENQGNGYGVAGRATTGTGVFADTQSGTSLLATADGGGTGVKTSAPNSGTALQVTGRAKFSRSGVVTIAAGSSSGVVTLAGVNTNSMILATAQQAAGVSVKAAVPIVPSSGKFTIYLTGNAPAAGLKVAYFVLN
jgi:hypothetical protein